MVIKSLSKRTSAKRSLISSSNTKVSAGSTRVAVVDPTSLPNCELWYEGDKNFTGASIDSGSDPWVYDSIPNLGSLGGTFSSAAGARPMVGWIEVDTVGRRVITFDNSNDYQDSSLGASSWNFMHDGTGCTVIICAHSPDDSSSQYILDNFTAVNTGISIYRTAGAHSYTVEVSNSAGLVINDSAAGGSADIPGVFTLRHGSDNDVQYDMRWNGISITSGAYLLNPSASDPSDTLRIGLDTSDANPFAGQICSIIAYSRYLSDNEVLAVETYLDKYTNVTVPVSQSPTFYYNLSATNDYTLDDGNAEVGDQIDRIRDLSGNGHDAIQNTDSKQGTIGTDADGNTEIAVDGTADCYVVSAGAGWPAGTSHSAWVAIDAYDDNTPYQYLMNSGVSGSLLTFMQTINVANTTGFYANAFVGVATAASGEQDLEWHLDDTANTGDMYRNGLYIGTGAYSVSAVIGTPVALHSRRDLASAFYNGSNQEFWYRDSLQTNAEIFASRAYRAARYPTRWANTLPLVVPHGSDGCWLDTSAAANFVLDGTDIIAAKDCSKDLDDPITNGDFETGSPPSNWSAVSGATLSAQAGARTGGSGSQILRGTIASGDNNGSASQTTLVSGDRYLIDVWGRGDGTNGFPRISDGSALTDGTTSNTWQHLYAVANWGGTGLYLATVGDNATEDYAEWDDLVVTPGLHAYQATSANRPTYDAVNECMTFTGASTEWLEWVVPPSGGEGCIVFWWRSSDKSALQVPVGANDAAGTNKTWLQFDPTTGRPGFYLGSTAGVSPNVDLCDGSWHFLVCGWDATYAYFGYDGVAYTTQPVSGIASTVALYVGARNNNGGGAANPCTGDISGLQLFARMPSAAEISYLYALGRNP